MPNMAINAIKNGDNEMILNKIPLNSAVSRKEGWICEASLPQQLRTLAYAYITDSKAAEKNLPGHAEYGTNILVRTFPTIFYFLRQLWI